MPRLRTLLPLAFASGLLAMNGAFAGTALEVKPPGGNWQVPGEIQVPRGTWQVPGDIQVPKGIAAVKEVAADNCITRVTVVGDALFDFDSANLRSDAAETLAAAGPVITKAGSGKLRIVGHTDARGDDAYNDRLSDARAKTVRDWLVAGGFVADGAAYEGRGERQPVAANTLPDGSDNPEGRQQNRRVEVEIDACG
jgi:outer membrane protein OmpA-like peptidoglycan-associated protein